MAKEMAKTTGGHTSSEELEESLKGKREG